MERQTSNIRQSSMFLIELVIAILFLSLCSAICVRLFINARIVENDSYNLTQAVVAAQNIAEVFETGTDEASTDVYPDASIQHTDLSEYISRHFAGSSYVSLDSSNDYETFYSPALYMRQPAVTVYYDAQFMPCSSDDYRYVSYVFIARRDCMYCADIFIKKSSSSSDFNKDDAIYVLHVDHAINNMYLPVSSSSDLAYNRNGGYDERLF